MNFREKKGKYYYGYVKGTSMWPELIPRDILRAEMAATEEVSPGDIVVIAFRSDKPVVHRLVVKNTQDDNSLILITAGDRSGKDTPIRIGSEEELLRVTGVLRRGKWGVPGSKPFRYSSRIPNSIIRLHYRIVRKFCW